MLVEFDTRVLHIELADEDVFGRLELVDIPAEAAAHEPWFNETLTSVNDAVVRLGVIEGDSHRHKHDEQDEFFLVLDGELRTDIEDADTVVGSAPRDLWVRQRGLLSVEERVDLDRVDAQWSLDIGDVE